MKNTLEKRISKLESMLNKKHKFENISADDWDYEDWDFEDMVTEHGNEFLSEVYPDSALFSMDEFNEFETDAFEAVRKAFAGKDATNGGAFNPNCEWFTYDGYGNLVSVLDENQFLIDKINKNEFLEWCLDNGYVG